jgi:hypothetical protein
MFRRVAVAISLVAALVLVYPGTANATIRNVGYKWAGDQVIREIWVNFDDVNSTLQGVAVITDNEGGGNYDVAVNDVRLEARGCSFCVVTTLTGPVADNDGWHPGSDIVATNLYEFFHIPGEIRAVARFRWKNSAGTVTEQWMASNWWS